MCATPTRILVTGDREWLCVGVAGHVISRLIARYGADLLIVHGAARGVDQAFEMAARELGVATEPHPADWSRHGRRAGPVRNQEMVDLGAHFCVAVHRDLSASRGTADCVGRCLEIGIPVWLIDSDDVRPRRVSSVAGDCNMSDDSVKSSASTFVGRLDTLEAENIKLRSYLAWLGTLTFVSVLLLGASVSWILLRPAGSVSPGGSASVVRAQSFVIVDKNGRERGVFGGLPGEVPSLSLLDAKGDRRVSLYTDNKTGDPMLVLSDPGNVGRVMLGAGPSIQTGLVVSDHKGTRRLVMGVDESGDPGFDLRDASSSLRLVSEVLPDGSPRQLFCDSKGRKRLALFVRPPQDPVLVMTSGDDKPSVSLGFTDEAGGGTSYFVLQDAGGRVQFQAPDGFVGDASK